MSFSKIEKIENRVELHAEPLKQPSKLTRVAKAVGNSWAAFLAFLIALLTMLGFSFRVSKGGGTESTPLDKITAMISSPEFFTFAAAIISGENTFPSPCPAMYFLITINEIGSHLIILHSRRFVNRLVFQYVFETSLEKRKSMKIPCQQHRRGPLFLKVQNNR